MPKIKRILINGLIDMGEILEQEGFMEDNGYARWKEAVYNQVIFLYGYTSDELTRVDRAFWEGEYVFAQPPDIPDPNRTEAKDKVVTVLKTFIKKLPPN